MGRRIREHSAGGVVIKRNGSRIEVLLIQPRGRHRWQLPKGAIDPGETPESAAVREVREEGGVEAWVVGSLHPITFFYQMHGRRFVKTVDFYLMEYKSGSPAEHDDEVDEARWFPSEEAVRTLTFESEQEVLRSALTRLEQGGASVAS